MEDHEFPCSSVLADFLSPRVSRLHDLDPSLGYYEFTSAVDSDALESVLRLAQGQSISAEESIRPSILEIGAELENPEICSLAATHIDESLSLDAVLERYQLAKHLRLNLSEFVAFLASHFYLLTEATLQSFDFDDFALILCHEKLQVKSEDSIYAALSSRLPKDPGLFSLMEYVYFDFLSDESVKEFVSATLAAGAEFVVEFRGVEADLPAPAPSCVARLLLGQKDPLRKSSTGHPAPLLRERSAEWNTGLSEQPPFGQSPHQWNWHRDCLICHKV
jgi:hypothetical protein